MILTESLFTYYTIFRPILLGLMIAFSLLLPGSISKVISNNPFYDKYRSWLLSQRGIATICALSGAWLLNYTLYDQNIIIIFLSIVLLGTSIRMTAAL
jgi:uncharacterized membrane protein